MKILLTAFLTAISVLFLQVSPAFAQTPWNIQRDIGDTDKLKFWYTSAPPAVSPLTITTDGKVGIGTANPQIALDVRVGGDNDIAQFYSNNTVKAARIYGANDTYGGVLGLFGNDGTTEAVRISGANDSWFTGKVGIGTIAPGAKLDVQGINQAVPFNAGNSQNAMLHLQSQSSALGSGADILFSSYYTGTSTFAAASIGTVRMTGADSGTGYANTDLVFRTSAYPNINTEKMRITSTGQVKVSGAIYSQNNGEGYLGLFTGSGSLPGYPTLHYPTLKTDFSYLYFSVAGNFSAYMDSAGVITTRSDRNIKENFTEINPQKILEKIDKLPMYQWNFKGEDPGIKHIAPVAQDFYAAFDLNGHNDKMISAIDPAGVAIVGIKGLSEKIKTQQEQIDKLVKENEQLKIDLTEIKKLLNKN